MNTAAWMLIGTPHLDTCKAHGELGTSMKAVSKSNELILASVNGGKKQSTLIGFGASGAEEGFLQVARGYSRKKLCQIYKVFSKIDVADMLQALDLLDNLGGDFRIAMSAVYN